MDGLIHEIKLFIWTWCMMWLIYLHVNYQTKHDNTIIIVGDINRTALAANHIIELFNKRRLF